MVSIEIHSISKKETLRIDIISGFPGAAGLPGIPGIKGRDGFPGSNGLPGLPGMLITIRIKFFKINYFC